MKIKFTNFRCWENKEITFNPDQSNLIHGKSGKGKCLLEDTIVRMFDGSYKKVQDVKIGDILLGDDGKERNVGELCSGYGDIYEIRPVKGMSYYVNEEHILSLIDKISGHIMDIPLKYFLNEEFDIHRFETYHVVPDFGSQDHNDRIGDLLNVVHGTHVDVINSEITTQKNRLLYSIGCFIQGDTKISHTQSFDFNIIYHQKDNYYGFTLDGNSRFLLEDNKVTHNSSILEGINFGLYGVGNKVISNNASSCKVEIWIDDMYILRSKRPNRLLLKKEGEFKEDKKDYEDKEAQEIINKKFGYNFEITSYLRQKSHNSFLHLSPMEKLNILEKLIGIDVKDMKNLIKTKTKKKEEELNSLKGSISVTKSMCDSIIVPEKVECSCLIENDIDVSMKNEKERLKDCIKKLSIYQDEMTQLRSNISKLTEIKNKINIMTERRSVVKLEIKDNEKKIKDLGDINIDTYKILLKEQRAYNKQKQFNDLYVEKKKQYDDLYNIERDRLLSELNEPLWDSGLFGDKENALKLCVLLEGQKIKDNYKSILLNEFNNEKPVKKNVRNVDDIKKDISIIDDKLIRLKEAKKIRSCPKCNAKFKINEDDKIILCNIDDIIDSNTSELNKQKKILIKELNKSEEENINYITRLNKYNDLIQNIGDNYISVSYSLGDINEYISINNEKEKRHKKIKNMIKKKEFSNTLKALKNDLDKIIFTDLEELDFEYTEIELEKIIFDLENKLTAKNIYTEILESLNDEFKNINTSLQEFRDDNTLELIDKLNSKLPYLEKEYRIEQDKYPLLEENINQLNLYKIYIDKLCQQDEWKDKLEKYTEELSIKEKELVALGILKNKIIQAESIYMFTCIERINELLKHYLNMFFTEDPIFISLNTEKGNGVNKEKTQLNISVEYKGSDIDILSLSGGERDRVDIAFVLAFSDLVKSPILMLDESLSSLDQETSDIIISSLLTTNKKYLLIIAHQISLGLFNNVISL